jgi:hypothetical protein
MSQPRSPAPILAAAQAEPLPELSQMCDTPRDLPSGGLLQTGGSGRWGAARTDRSQFRGNFRRVDRL